MPDTSFAAQIRKTFALTKIRTWVLVFILLIAFGIIAREMKRTEIEAGWKNFHTLREPRTVTPEKIRSWMTFEYLNAVFHLPTEYLRETLNIKSVAYPRITLKRSAKEQGIDLNDFVGSVRAAIENFPR